MSRQSHIDPAARFLQDGETVVVALDGVVNGYTRWSGLGGIVGIVTALTVPRVLSLSFLPGAVAIVGVLLMAFGIVYAGAGRPLAKRHDPPLQSPYLRLVLTDQRVLLLDRPLGSDEPELVEEARTVAISAVRYGAAGALVPQRLGFVIGAKNRREFEFARSANVRKFVDYFS